ncbi:hypothetical protein B932_2777 [Gluconobacter oxydans H24]|nr:hypothetical protein B932_2777 [Gluconobacter oxydans H24]
MANGSGNPGAITTCRYTQHTTQALDRPTATMLTDEGEPHIFWLAKNCVAFFKISLSSRRMRFSRRRRSFSRARSACGSGPDRSEVRYCETQCPNVDLPIPRSAATLVRDKPLLKAILIASRRNSSVYVTAMVSYVPRCELKTLSQPTHNRSKSSFWWNVIFPCIVTAKGSLFSSADAFIRVVGAFCATFSP